MKLMMNLLVTDDTTLRICVAFDGACLEASEMRCL